MSAAFSNRPALEIDGGESCPAGHVSRVLPQPALHVRNLNIGGLFPERSTEPRFQRLIGKAGLSVINVGSDAPERKQRRDGNGGNGGIQDFRFFRRGCRALPVCSQQPPRDLGPRLLGLVFAKRSALFLTVEFLKLQSVGFDLGGARVL